MSDAPEIITAIQTETDAVGRPTYNALDRVYTPTDQGLLIRHSTLKGIQASSLIAPPLVLLLRFRRPIPVMATLAKTTFLLGGTAGFAVGAARTLNMTKVGISSRAERLRESVGQGREDEMAIAGAGIGSALFGYFLRNRVPLPSRLLGGASIGVSLGVLTHLYKNHVDGTFNSTYDGVLGMWQELKAGVVGTDKIPRSEEDKKREVEAGEFWHPGYDGV
ncbi:hypothetical protein P7C70_g6377, partial [Phenoliferia sp. Uapishka_3]